MQPSTKIVVINVLVMLNENTLGARPIRGSCTYVQPKSLISVEAKKSPIKDVLNDIQ